ncbi:MAG: undecaprenyl-diphosphate phosphatase [Ilumatobacteraceae bacterium]
MPILHALILGIVQGLTEFLPISSSGHLELVPWLFGWNDLADESVAKAFDTSLHLGTLIAVVLYMRAELKRYIVGGLSALRGPRHASTTGKAAWLFVASAIPAGVVGLVAQDWITDALGGAGSIAVSLIVFGGVLWWADRRTGERTVEEYRLRDAVLTGCAQVLALNPGTSRSGITISMARVIGFSRDASARISFLMSIPVIAAAVVLQLGSLLSDGLPDGLGAALVVGVVASGVSGWFAMWSMIRILRTRRFTGFVMYRVAVGVGVLILLSTSFR